MTDTLMWRIILASLISPIGETGASVKLKWSDTLILAQFIYEFIIDMIQLSAGDCSPSSHIASPEYVRSVIGCAIAAFEEDDDPHLRLSFFQYETLIESMENDLIDHGIIASFWEPTDAALEAEANAA